MKFILVLCLIFRQLKMARVRKRKSDKGQFREDDMKNAAKMVLARGVSVQLVFKNKYRVSFYRISCNLC